MKKSLKLLILCAVIGLAGTKAQAQVGISVRIGPPALPVYVQPPCPVDGYLWQPGYWAYDDADGYYWVPGAWVAPPDPGLLWTPCYWGWDNGVYLFHAGYWGPHVGFYGGINYGFGYPGSGFYGGVWSGRSFRYNTAVFNVNRTVIHNTYVNRSFPHGGGSRVSYNGGHGGINRQPSATERRFSSEHHVAATHAQMEHQQNAGRNPGQRFNTNHGRPATLAGRPDARAANQQARISNGQARGTMNAHETHNVQNRESHVNNEVNHDRAANHGGLTPAEHQQVNRQQNNISHTINRDNHNANNAPRMQQHASQPQQHANRMPSQPQQHMGGGGFGGGRPAGGGMPHGGGFGGGGHPMGGGGGMPHGGGGGGHPMGGGGGHGGGGHHG